MGHRHRIFGAMLVAGVLVSTSACASSGYVYGRPGPSQQGVDARAYRNGYDAGRVEGMNDVRQGRRYQIDRNRLYRSADRGYDGYGNRGYYQRAFREGYQAGYNDGYQRSRPGGPGYGNGPVYGRPGYGAPGYGGPGAGGGFTRSPAAGNGYRDGLAQGRDDARDRDRYDPVRASRYRQGDRGYNNRYGSRDDYKREYRSAFQQGYEQGYYNGRR